MLFNSFEFLLIFLPLTFAGFSIAARRGRFAQLAWLGFCSVVFYGIWNPESIPLLLGSIGLNFLFGRIITKYVALKKISHARMALISGLIINISLLGYYKYADFLIATICELIGSAYVPLTISLPLGISFFTFTQIAYLVDCFRGHARSGRFTSYFLFVTFFPHLIAGPILHHSKIIPQFEKPNENGNAAYRSLAMGISIFSIGLFKKLVFADSLAPFSNGVFDASAIGVPVTFFEAWMGALSYGLQLYFDFSAYSDMAIGIAMMFGIALPVNFSSPYKAGSISEFWKRWHMTLSAFLKNYLYIPLGGSRFGRVNTYRNLLITMLLGGIWHGAGWTFVLWGMVHGALLVANRLWRACSHRWLGGWTVPFILAWTATFLSVTFAWVPFRATSLEATSNMWTAMLGTRGITLPQSISTSVFAKHLEGVIEFTGMFPHQLGEWAPYGFVLVGFALISCVLIPSVQEIFKLEADPTQMPAEEGLTESSRQFSWSPSLGWTMATVAMFIVAMSLIGKPTEFLYFRF